MTITPYEAMQAAVDIVHQSPHPTNKIAASLLVGDTLTLATNGWPRPIEEKIGTFTRIGNSSGTVHAEVSCILNATVSDGGSLFITDPFCPNCAKNIAESGVKKIYIDHKGFQKDFANRRGDDFGTMSLRIAGRAGIAIYQIFRKEQRVETLHEPPEGYKPPEDNPIVKIKSSGDKTPIEELLAFIHAAEKEKKGRFTCAYARAHDGTGYLLLARLHPAIGFTMDHDAETVKRREGKYSFMLEPANRILMAAARFGLRIDDGLLYASQLPTSREQVNLVAANMTAIMMGTDREDSDDEARAARALLSSKGILQFRPAA